MCILITMLYYTTMFDTSITKYNIIRGGGSGRGTDIFDMFNRGI